MWSFKSQEHAALYFWYLPLKEVSLFHSLQKDKKSFYQEIMPTEEPVYFHSSFSLTLLQPACAMLFCRNEITVGLLRSFQAFLQPTHTLGKLILKGTWLEAWELLWTNLHTMFELTCWRRSRCSWELLKFFPMSKRQKVSCWQTLTQSWYSPGSGRRSRKIR